jgi:hypothetical protein
VREKEILYKKALKISSSNVMVNITLQKHPMRFERRCAVKTYRNLFIAQRPCASPTSVMFTSLHVRSYDGDAHELLSGIGSW